MNFYHHVFTVRCPNNRVLIRYSLLIETLDTIMVEKIIDACRVKSAFHEALADRLHHKFKGRQVLCAYHHGVWIETRRGDL